MLNMAHPTITINLSFAATFMVIPMTKEGNAMLPMDDYLWDMSPSLRQGNCHANVSNKGKKEVYITIALLPFVIGITMNVVARDKVMVISALIYELPHKVAQDPLFIGFHIANYAGIVGSGVSTFLFNNVDTQG
ncbi:hypothetical protein LguiA_004462 [Lonicera macranthoides]